MCGHSKLMHSVKAKICLKKHDREMVCAYAWQAKIPPATGKRRVSLHVTHGKGMREFDDDAPWKSLLDAMPHAKLIVDDSCKYVEHGPVTFSPDPKAWGTAIRLEDL
jgi:hypothetical protein